MPVSYTDPIVIDYPFANNLPRGIAVTQDENGSFSHENPTSNYAAAYDFDIIDTSRTATFNVLSASDGIVISIRDGVPDTGSGGIGNYVTILHNPGENDQFYATYLHLENGSGSTAVAVGDEIAASDFIGIAGNSGNSTGIHLHFQFSLELDFASHGAYALATDFYDNLIIFRDGNGGTEMPNAGSTVASSLTEGDTYSIPGNYIVENNIGAANNLTGTSGDDWFFGGAGIDSYNGASGNDTVDFRDRGGINWDVTLGASGTAVATGNSSGTEQLTSIENVNTFDGNDIIRLSSDNNIVNASGGTDIVIFEESSSQWSFSGTDTIDGIIGTGANGQRDEFSGVETFRFTDGDFSWDNLPTGGGNLPLPDIEILSANLDSNVITEGEEATIEYTITNSGNTSTVGAVDTGFYISTDNIFGNADDVFLERDGAGILSVGEVRTDTDTLGDLADQAPGNYFIFAVGNFDDAEADSDTSNNVSDPIALTILSAPTSDFTPGSDTFVATDGNDVLDALGGNDTVRAGLGDDTVSGGEGNDNIRGEAGADTLNGDAGNDIIDGGNGNDTINGGTGDDTLRGNGGVDTIYGVASIRYMVMLEMILFQPVLVTMLSLAVMAMTLY